MQLLRLAWRLRRFSQSPDLFDGADTDAVGLAQGTVHRASFGHSLRRRGRGKKRSKDRRRRTQQSEKTVSQGRQSVRSGLRRPVWSVTALVVPLVCPMRSRRVV